MCHTYNPGDVIMDNCYPLMKALLVAFKGIRCNNCFEQPNDLLPCPTCSLYNYCNLECQTQDWDNGHAVECKSDCFRQYCVKGNFTDLKRYIFRMYAQLKLNPELASKPLMLHDGKTRCFNDLLSHEDKIAGNRVLLRKCQKMAARINADDPDNKVEVPYLIRLLGIHHTNSFAVSDGLDKNWIGWGIYVEPAVFDHSCKPNSVFVTSGLKLQIRAIGPILPGMEPHISYLGKVVDRAQRQKSLQERYNFQCGCMKCLSNSDDKVDYVTLKALMTRMRRLEKNLVHGEGWAAIKVQHQEIIEVLRTIFHEYDVHITFQHIRALNIALKLGLDKEELKKLFEDVLHHVMMTYGKEHLKYKELEDKFTQEFQ